MTKSKITTGLNDRPKGETISQTGQGLPDDSSTPFSVDEAEIARVRDKLMNNSRKALKEEVEEEIDLPQKGSA